MVIDESAPNSTPTRPQSPPPPLPPTCPQQIWTGGCQSLRLTLAERWCFFSSLDERVLSSVVPGDEDFEHLRNQVHPCMRWETNNVTIPKRPQRQEQQRLLIPDTVRTHTKKQLAVGRRKVWQTRGSDAGRTAWGEHETRWTLKWLQPNKHIGNSNTTIKPSKRNGTREMGSAHCTWLADQPSTLLRPTRNRSTFMQLVYNFCLRHDTFC